MNRVIHILFAIILTLLSCILVYLNFQQNSRNNSVGFDALSPLTYKTASKVISYQSKSGVKEYNSVIQESRATSSVKPAYATRMDFDYTMVSVEGSQLRSGSKKSGVRSFSGNYSRSVPQSSKVTSSLPTYSGARNIVNPTAYKSDYSNNSGSFKVQPFSKQNPGQLAANTNSNTSNQNNNGLFNSGLLASNGQVRQGANAATLDDPLGIDPGGDPEDPGEMIPVPDGLSFLIFLALLYFFLKFTLQKLTIRFKKSTLL